MIAPTEMFQTLTFAGISLPAYGSRAEPLFAISDIARVYNDPDLRTTAKKDILEKYVRSAYVVDASERVKYVRLVTKYGLLAYAFGKNSPAAGFEDWIMRTLVEFDQPADPLAAPLAVQPAIPPAVQPAIPPAVPLADQPAAK